MNPLQMLFAALAAVVVAAGVWFLIPKEEAPVPSQTSMENEGAKEGESMKAEEGTTMMLGAEGETSTGGDVMMKDGEEGASADGAMMEQKGSYESYELSKVGRAEKGDVVLFFRASWCPTCRALDADIRANASAIPAGLTILDVDYDAANNLRQKYGVTSQHTLVQVDAAGNLLKKWQGSATLAALAAQVQ